MNLVNPQHEIRAEGIFCANIVLPAASDERAGPGNEAIYEQPQHPKFRADGEEKVILYTMCQDLQLCHNPIS